MDDQGLLQKKAYKLLLVVINKVHFTFLQEVIELLKTCGNDVANGSRPFRLSCLKEIWKNLEFD